MPTLDALATGFVSLPSVASYYLLFPSLLIQFIGVTVALVTFGSNFGKPNDPSAKILLSIVVSDVLFCSTILIVGFCVVLNRGFSLGIPGCIANYYFIMASSCASILNIIIASVERYYAVVKGERWSNQRVNRVISVLWIYSFSQAFVPMLSESYSAIRLEETVWSCLVKWYGRDWASLTITIVASIVFGVGFSIVSYCYMSVYRTFSNAIHTQKKVTASHIQKERRVFYMCLMLTGSFLVLWIPSLINVTYELISGVPLHPDWAIVPSFMSSIPSATNSMVLLYFDNRIRGNVMKFLSRFRKEPFEAGTSSETEVSRPTNNQSNDHGKSIFLETTTKLIVNL